MKKQANIYVIYAVFAAFFFSLSVPVSRWLLTTISPYFLSSLLYAGAGLFMLCLVMFQPMNHQKHPRMTGKHLPALIGMILLDVVAPIAMLIGLQSTLPAQVSLLNNFEIVATSFFAYFLFKETIPTKLRLGIVLVTLASIILSINVDVVWTFTSGSWWVLFAAMVWGLENNFTRVLSVYDPRWIVMIKGFGSSLIGLLITFLLQGFSSNGLFIGLGLTIGMLSYGLSLWFYMSAQRHLGAAKTASFYAFAPFIGVVLSFIFFFEAPSITFYIGLMLMAIGAYFSL